uniref:Uncharacterized protein n=1 Tax=Alexandrium catenella TaxID=2925 RepID=A0A7S1RYL9_ALECA|mmetsp:Transcript_78945/g.209653  ORF Transcript_78945/g.209653 Transcript_78945/m.209653 type:complete len:230 (+) Transcript_78945:45-734(+)
MELPAREVLASQAMQGHAVYGLNIPDPRLAKLTKRVLCIVIFTSVVAVVNSLWNYIAGQTGNGTRVSPFMVLLSLGIALLVPCCGYFGAKKNDRNLTGWFCGCNFLGGCLGIFSLVMSFVGLQGLHFLVDNCTPETRHDHCPSPDQWTSLCPDMSAYTAQECYDHLQGAMANLDRTLHLSVITSVPTVALQCLSFVWGKRLHDELGSGQVIHRPPQFATQAGFTQPFRQ